MNSLSNTPNDQDAIYESKRKRVRKACTNCKAKKIRCSGDKPKCENCLNTKSECVYAPMDKRISILQSKYQEMNTTIEEMQQELDHLKSINSQIRQSIIPSRVPTPANNNFIRLTTDNVMAQASSTPSERFITGSSDIIITKLAELQGRRSQNSLRLPNSQNQHTKNEHQYLNRYFQDCEYRVCEFLKKLDLETAFGLVEICHFYLNDVYFPYDINLMKLKMKTIYLPVICFGSFLDDDDTFFKPLLLLTLALGKRYKGEVNSESIINDLLKYSFWFINPIVNMKQLPQNYLIVSIFTIASLYFRSRSLDDDAGLYSNLALQFATHLKLHKSESGPLDNNEMQLKSRIIWTCYGINRTTSTKMGDPHLLSFENITRGFPTLISYDESNNIIPYDDKTAHSSEFKFYVELIRIVEDIYNVFYANNASTTLTSMLGNVIQKLISWNASLPDSCRLESNKNEVSKKRKRLICSLHLNYCFSIHLTTIPVIYSLVERQKHAIEPIEINENIYELVIICMNAAQMTVNILSSCLVEEMLAVFGVMDLDYIYSASLTLFMCGDILKIQSSDCSKLLDSCLFIMSEMSKRGNTTATFKCQRLEELINNSRIPRDETVFPALEVQSSSRQHSVLPEHQPPVSVEQGLHNFDGGTSFAIKSSVVETFLSLDEQDLNIWEDGYRNFLQTDSYWDDFKKDVFGSGETGS